MTAHHQEHEAVGPNHTQHAGAAAPDDCSLPGGEGTTCPTERHG